MARYKRKRRMQMGGRMSNRSRAIGTTPQEKCERAGGTWNGTHCNYMARPSSAYAYGGQTPESQNAVSPGKNPANNIIRNKGNDNGLDWKHRYSNRRGKQPPRRPR